ncbi:tripartite tricarboxylate transporter permease [Rhodococcoides fascians]|uniref:tripartite tricarboxylate transporter permease n=1 Tax=Rhodococcoides fascians TaxID=1828 RepID=UPI00056BDAC0|nr:tripartite tricarboxylate transporter permease [Rhodococcus fascians]
MLSQLLQELPTGLLWALIGSVVFGALGLVSGTDETATITPITLLVVLLGVPPVGIFAFFIAAVVSKHLTHMIPTTMLGIPGDTMAIPLLEEANFLRRLGVPHIALRKAISGGIIAALIAVPVSVGIAGLLSPFADTVSSAAPWIFLAATVLIAFFSPARIAGVLVVVPFVMLILGLRAIGADFGGQTLTVSFFLGIAAGPLILDLLLVSSPAGRRDARRDGVETRHMSTAGSASSKYFPNPLKILDTRQVGLTAATSAVSASTFVFSPVAMTVIMGEAIRRFPKNAYHRLTTRMAVKNGTTESTYLGETLIPLVAFGLPLSPMSVGPAAPLFNAPPRFTVDTETGQVNNLHTFMSSWEFLVFGLIGVIVAAIVVYPLAMKFAAPAASFVMRNISHESVVAAFAALILMVAVWEGGVYGVLVVMTVGLVGGLLSRAFKLHAGVQFMAFYVALLTVPAILALF